MPGQSFPRAADPAPDSGAALRRRLGSETVIRIADAVTRHPRFGALFVDLAGLDAWLERAQRHFAAEVERIGPTKARRQLRRIVNEVALVGDPVGGASR